LLPPCGQKVAHPSHLLASGEGSGALTNVSLFVLNLQRPSLIAFQMFRLDVRLVRFDIPGPTLRVAARVGEAAALALPPRGRSYPGRHRLSAR
jgi:hypothetical protein